MRGASFTIPCNRSCPHHHHSHWRLNRSRSQGCSGYMADAGPRSCALRSNKPTPLHADLPTLNTVLTHTEGHVLRRDVQAIITLMAVQCETSHLITQKLHYGRHATHDQSSYGPRCSSHNTGNPLDVH